MVNKGLAFSIVILCLSVSGTLSCRCPYSPYFQDLEDSVNTLVLESILLTARALISCDRIRMLIETKWEIVRADGSNEAYYLNFQWKNRYRDSNADYQYQENGITIFSKCSYNDCNMAIIIFLNDTRYDGAQITAYFRISDCSYSETAPVRINIQDSTPEPPTNLTVEVLSEESINMSWSPPPTLNGLPILYYTVYITSSQRPVEERNTTDTYIILERPCVPTSYQITAWNHVRQGVAVSYDVNYYEPLERETITPGQICLSCSLIKESIDAICGLQTTRGCLVRLESEDITYTFNFTDKNDEDLVLFDCFSIQEPINSSVTVYDTDSGVIVHSAPFSINYFSPESHTPSDLLQVPDNNLMVVVLSTGWGVTLLVVILFVLSVVCVKKRLRKKTEPVRGADVKTATSHNSDESISQQTSTVTPVVYDTVIQTHAAATGEENNMYELIELSSKARQEKIKVVPNASYGTVQQ